MAVKCWAACVGGCVNEQSREHVVSQAIFTDSVVTVHGLHWCKHEPKAVGLAAVTAKTLCRLHNSQLSELDSAAGHFYSMLRASLKLSGERRKLMPWVTPNVERFQIDAGRLERWLVKTLININDQDPTPFAMDGSVPVPQRLVEICLGTRAFEGHAGLYMAAYKGMDIVMNDSLRFSPLTEDDLLLGGFFTLHGLCMFLWLDGNRPPPNLSAVPGIEPGWKDADLNWRFKQIQVMHGIWPSHYIEFDWASALRHN